MALKILYRLYDYRLWRSLDKNKLPRHIGVILDGNRRWAKLVGASASHGHKKGADKVHDLLWWCQETGIEVVTLWLLSTDNLKRGTKELAGLLEIIAQIVEHLTHNLNWQLKLVGSLELVKNSDNSADEAVIHAIERIDKALAIEHPNAKLTVNVAIGYGGRQEIVNAVRCELLQAAKAGKTLTELAESFNDQSITNHLYTAGQPEPDLVIRTSGEQRLSGFMIWQSVHTEYYFCEVYWPAFRRTDFYRALRDFSSRERRLGK